MSSFWLRYLLHSSEAIESEAGELYSGAHLSRKVVSWKEKGQVPEEEIRKL